jgi:adenylate cyclase
MPKTVTEAEWRSLLLGDLHESSKLRKFRHALGRVPSHPRCKVCQVPFRGVGGAVFRLMGWRQFEKNPNFCRNCIITNQPGGTEVEISILFADVRGSTTMAEKMSPAEFSKIMNHFYTVTTDVLVRSDAWLDKLVGDEVIGLYIPGFAGPQHAQLAVNAAQELLRATGHGNPDGPWIPVGVGVHTGLTYVGLVGVEGGISDMTALGDSMNTTARLSSEAQAGEVLVSKAACTAAELDVSKLEQRQLQLKGRTEPVDVSVLSVN